MPTQNSKTHVQIFEYILETTQEEQEYEDRNRFADLV